MELDGCEEMREIGKENICIGNFYSKILLRRTQLSLKGWALRV